MNKKTNEIIFIGYSGHSYTVIDVAKKAEYEPKGYFDLVENTLNPFQLTYLGNERAFDFSRFNSIVFPAIGDNQLRMKIHQFIQENKLNECYLIHPNTTLGFGVSVGFSTLIAAGAIINPLGKIGAGCILNTGCILDHEATIEKYVHIGPGATLAGNVTVGEGTFIGANTTVIQGVKIGKNCIIGAGSVVLKNVSDNTVIVGNPAKFLRRND
jgi:sugar O-acyltransferase (sialic acid O-acetyltransferase NeuD family)